METDTNSWGFFALAFPWGLLAFVLGLLAYKGKIAPPPLANTYLGMWLILYRLRTRRG